MTSLDDTKLFIIDMMKQWQPLLSNYANNMKLWERLVYLLHKPNGYKVRYWLKRTRGNKREMIRFLFVHKNWLYKLDLKKELLSCTLAETATLFSQDFLSQ